MKYLKNYLMTFNFRKYGKPHLFLTFTATSKWPEIQNSLGKGETSYDRPDIVCRVFKMKLRQLMDDLINKHILGRVKSWLYMIEFQKRGYFLSRPYSRPDKVFA